MPMFLYATCPAVRAFHLEFIEYHFVREKVESDEISIVYCPMEEMIADIVTKPLPEGTFVHLPDQITVSANDHSGGAAVTDD